MNQYKCINVNCTNVLFSDSNPKDVCFACAEIISGDAERDER